MAYTEQQVRDIIQRGETDQVELKAEVRDPFLLSLHLGLRQRQRRCDRHRGAILQPHPWLRPQSAHGRLRRRAQLVGQTQVGSLEFVQLDGKDVGLLKVAKSDKLVASTSGAYVRKGSGTMSMTADQIFGKAAASGETSLRSLSNLIYDQMVTIDKLRRSLEASHSWRSKATDFAISGIVGAALGVALSKIFMK